MNAIEFLTKEKGLKDSDFGSIGMTIVVAELCEEYLQHSNKLNKPVVSNEVCLIKDCNRPLCKESKNFCYTHWFEYY